MHHIARLATLRKKTGPNLKTQSTFAKPNTHWATGSQSRSRHLRQPSPAMLGLNKERPATRSDIKAATYSHTKSDGPTVHPNELWITKRPCPCQLRHQAVLRTSSKFPTNWNSPQHPHRPRPMLSSTNIKAWSHGTTCWSPREQTVANRRPRRNTGRHGRRKQTCNVHPCPPGKTFSQLLIARKGSRHHDHVFQLQLPPNINCDSRLPVPETIPVESQSPPLALQNIPNSSINTRQEFADA